jgi:thiol-disulfide isomerase/thioredoxin
MSRAFVPALAGLTVLVMTAVTLAGARPASGQAAPPLRLADLKGREISLESFRGKPVLLHFWATWCQHCRNEMPLLERTARAHGNGLVVLGVNLAEKRRKVIAYVAETGITFPILLDPRGNAAAAYDVVSLPTTLLIDPMGRITAEIPMGSMTQEDLEARLRPFL